MSEVTAAGNYDKPAFGAAEGGRRRTRRGPSAKALKRVLKSHGLKSSGKKATLRARAKKAHLLSKA